MKCKRLNEVLELLQPYWSKDPDLTLLQILQKIADEAGFDKLVAELSDEVIIFPECFLCAMVVKVCPKS